MATRQERHKGNLRGHGRRLRMRNAKDDGKEPTMTLTRKLMLSAELVGMEAVVNFQQIYTVPALQTMGMPLSLTYLPGLVSGPTSILILPILGWLMDRGDNPVCRRITSIIFAATLQTLGILCLLSANFLQFRYLLNYNATRTSVNTVTTTTTASLNDTGFLDWAVGLDVGGFSLNGSVLGGGDLNTTSFEDSGDIMSKPSGSPDLEDTGGLNVPFKAGLAMLGFILMDLGFDASNCFVKAFLVSCSPRAEHTSLIVLGVMMGAVGGVINASLGLVDFTSLLGLSDIQGAQLIVQTSVQGVLIIFIVFLGLLTTIITGIKQLRHRQQTTLETNTMKVPDKRPRAKYSKFHDISVEASLRFHEASTASYLANPESRRKRRNSLVDAFETSIRSFGGGSIYVEPSASMLGQTPHTLAEEVPLLEDDSLEEEDRPEERHVDGDQVTSRSVGYDGAVDSGDQSQEKTSSVAEHGGGVLGSDRGCLSCLQKPKVKIFFVCLTTFFSTAAMVLFAYTVSDFVGKAIYQGDPMGEPGSEGLTRYQAGIQTASWALLVYFFTYFASSLVHTKVLAVLGFRVEFLLLQLLLVVTMVVAGVTKRTEAVFVLAVVAALHRTCHYTMPFAVTNDIAQDIVSTGSGRSPVGLAISLVAASIPLSYCALFSWAGAVEQLTGDVSAPLWMGSAAGVLAVIAFLFVGKV